MKKARQILSFVYAFITVAFASLLTACAKETTIYLTVKSDDNKLSPFLIVGIIVGVLIVIALIVLKTLSDKKKREAAEAEAEANAVVLTQDPNAVSEYISEDERKAAEEAENEQPEEKAEETEEKTAEPDNTAEETEEESSEEAPEEEAKETVVEEDVAESIYNVTADETATEETIEESTDEAEEEPTEETEDEQPEETVEESAEETETAEEEPDEEPVAASDTSEADDKADVAEELVEEDEETYTIGANGLPVAPPGKVIRYKWSVLARLIMADDELKYQYMILRRKLLAYKKVRSNVSWNFDSYFIGRKPIVKLKVRGKTLVAYFPLDPNEMSGTKYVGEDVSAVARYKAVPFAYRINGMRKLKYAIELIEKQLEGVKFTEPEYLKESQVGEAIPRESLKKLYDKGYIRVGGILNVGERAASQDEDDEDEDVAVTDTGVDEEAAPSPLREVFNFNPKAQ